MPEAGFFVGSTIRGQHQQKGSPRVRTITPSPDAHLTLFARYGQEVAIGGEGPKVPSIADTVCQSSRLQRPIAVCSTSWSPVQGWSVMADRLIRVVA